MKTSTYRWTVVIGILIFSVFTLWILSTPWGKGRIQQTSIFSEGSGVAIRNQELIYDTGNSNPVLARVMHNKLFGYSREFFRQFFSYVSPQYLLTDGWGEKFEMREQGMLYFVFFVYLLCFIWYLSKERNDLTHGNALKYYLLLLAISLIPPSMTYVGSPNINRSMMFGVLVIPMIAYGAEMLKRYHLKIFILLCVFLAFECTYFALNYALHFNTLNALHRQDASKSLVQYIRQFQGRNIFIPQNSSKSIYYLFYNNILDSNLAGNFESDVRIPVIHNVHFISESNCFGSQFEANRIGVKKGDIVVLSHTCSSVSGAFPGLRHIATIKEVNILLGYDAYEYIGITGI